MSTLGKVLVVDDEPGLRNTITRLLQKAGCEVASAGDAAQAWELLEREAFDLVYLDIHLPQVDGMQLLRQLRQTWPELRVILLTGHGSLNSAVEALRLGATDYLFKPIDPADLVQRTQSLLQQVAVERRRLELQQQIAALQAELAALEESVGARPSEEAVASMTEAWPQKVVSSPSQRFLKCGRLTLDLQGRRVHLGERLILLPPTTFDYLAVLARYSPAVVDYQKLVTEALGYTVSRDEARELAKWHVHVIRQALEDVPEAPGLLINVRGQGYRLLAD